MFTNKRTNPLALNRFKPLSPSAPGTPKANERQRQPLLLKLPIEAPHYDLREETNETVERIRKFPYYNCPSPELTISLLKELDSSPDKELPSFKTKSPSPKDAPLSSFCILPVESLLVERKQSEGKYAYCKFPGFEVYFEDKSFIFYVVSFKKDQYLLVETTEDIKMLNEFIFFCQNNYKEALTLLGWEGKKVFTFDVAFAEESPVKGEPSCDLSPTSPRL